MTTTTTLSVGTVLESTDRRDNGRRVRIKRVLGSYYELENVETGRRTRVRIANVGKKYRQVTASVATTRTSAPTSSSKKASPLRSDRQRTALRVIKAKFSDFNKRQQHFYLGGGMSTTHVVTSIIADINDLHLFWPKELIRNKGLFGGHTYVLESDVMRRVQSSINRTLNELADLGHLEKVGNSDERRWKPTYAETN